MPERVALEVGCVERRVAPGAAVPERGPVLFATECGCAEDVREHGVGAGRQALSWCGPVSARSIHQLDVEPVGPGCGGGRGSCRTSADNQQVDERRS